jgi:hypothetical protein
MVLFPLGESNRITAWASSYIWDKGGLDMEHKCLKQGLLTLWKILVVALVNIMVYLMLSSGSPF